MGKEGEFGEPDPAVNMFLLRFFNAFFALLYNFLRKYKISIYTDITIAIRFLNVIKTLENNQNLYNEPASFMVGDYLIANGIHMRYHAPLLQGFKTNLLTYGMGSFNSDGEAVFSYFTIIRAIDNDESFALLAPGLAAGVDKLLIIDLVKSIVDARRGPGIKDYEADYLAETAIYILKRGVVI